MYTWPLVHGIVIIFDDNRSGINAFNSVSSMLWFSIEIEKTTLSVVQWKWMPVTPLINGFLLCLCLCFLAQTPSWRPPSLAFETRMCDFAKRSFMRSMNLVWHCNGHLKKPVVHPSVRGLQKYIRSKKIDEKKLKEKLLHACNLC